MFKRHQSSCSSDGAEKAKGAYSKPVAKGTHQSQPTLVLVPNLDIAGDASVVIVAGKKIAHMTERSRIQQSVTVGGEYSIFGLVDVHRDREGSEHGSLQQPSNQSLYRSDSQQKLGNLHVCGRGAV